MSHYRIFTGSKKCFNFKILLNPFEKQSYLPARFVDIGNRFCSKMKVVDMPKADIVFDRFHIMALMSKTIETLRREQQRTLEDNGKKVLKGCRFLLLRNYESLDDDYQIKLEALFDINKPLFTVHSMKEQLRLFWSQRTRQHALNFLRQWCYDAMMSGITPLAKVAITLAKHKEGILNYFPHRITSGAVEGTVNKIKPLKRQAYGFRDMEYFKLRLYHLHRQGYSLTG